jgi:hypothetical protein
MRAYATEPKTRHLLATYATYTSFGGKPSAVEYLKLSIEGTNGCLFKQQVTLRGFR